MPPNRHPHLTLGRQAVLPETILRPEIQDLKIFAEGVETIVSTNRRVAQAYIDDGRCGCTARTDFNKFEPR